MSLTQQRSLTSQQRRLLDALVSYLPTKLDILFEQIGVPDIERGACATYSRLLAQVLGEFGIKAAVRPVYVVTAERIALDYLKGKIGKEEAIRLGGSVQIWGDIKDGQAYQHAVCYIPAWDVIVDLAITRRGSGLVPAHPYWAVRGEFPWWIHDFHFMTYPLVYGGYEREPDKVREAKEFIRYMVRRYIAGWSSG